MLKAYIRQADHLVAIDIDATTEQEAAGAAVWYDLLAPTAAEDKFVEACLGIAIPTRDEMKDIEPSARLYNEDGAEFMTITALVNTDTDEPVKTQVTFVLRNNQLVTLRYDEPKAFGIVAKAIARPNGRISGEKVMASFSTLSSTGWRNSLSAPATRSTRSPTTCSATRRAMSPARRAICSR